MTVHDGFQLELPMQRGSLVVITILCHRATQGGWTLRLLHRHSGENAMCPSVDTYADLSSLEVAQVLEETLEAANGRFDLHGGECTPYRPSATDASASAE